MADLLGGTTIQGLLTVDADIKTDEGDLILDSATNTLDLGVLPTGSGNGLNADKLDGSHASSFVSSSGDTMTGAFTVQANETLDPTSGGLIDGGTISSPNKIFRGYYDSDGTTSITASSVDAAIEHVPASDGSSVLDVRVQGSDIIRAGSAGNVNIPLGNLSEGGNRVATRTWAQNTAKVNNADLLDGEHASAFADSGHTHDGRYYTETEADSNFAASGHLHDGRYIQDTGEVTDTLDAQNGILVTRGSTGLTANNSIEAVGTDDYIGIDTTSGATGGVLLGYYNAPEVRVGNGNLSDFNWNGDTIATQPWVGSNHVSVISDSTTEVTTNTTGINFGSNIDVTDDGDGTVTVDGTPGYTDSDARNAVNGSNITAGGLVVPVGTDKWV